MQKKKRQYPEEGELIIGTVSEIFGQGAFINLDEYKGKRGMLHISEISLKWVRNIRDYVKEGQKVVLQVLNVREDRGHIDLSLRRVADAQRKQKLKAVKQRQRAEKLVDLVAEELGKDSKKLFTSIEKKIGDEYETVYTAFEAISEDEKRLDELKLLPEGEATVLLKHIKGSIKPQQVEVIGYLKLTSTRPRGVVDIKNTLSEVEKHAPKNCELEVNYVSAPTYRIKVKAADYKKAEKALKNTVDQGIKFIKSQKGHGEFQRELTKP
ncbi:MAG: translation initiation factor IF-2 subunit alpha [Candidatus Altiarchaeales archaeon]|nr:translation initiation factor IF-2 subunit alpha [Candidatus Altiarchaeales archaeon]